jgi:large subunit ribosomal protein L30
VQVCFTTCTHKKSLKLKGRIMAENIKVTLVKSNIGSIKTIKATLIGLGLTKLNKSVIRKDTPELRGMVAKVSHLVRVEEA